MSEWVLEVSEVNEYVRQLLQNEPALRKVRLRGEISNFKRHSSGHWYFTLKDERCRIAAVMFRQNAMRMSIRPMDGMSVIVSGQVGLYSEGGSYQITCDSMRPDGIGTLYQQFEALKKRLAAEGLFDEEHKRRLPYRPKKIAVVTSETGAVLHDICMVSRARDPGVPLVLVPVQVQGAGAAESIAQGIRRAAKIPEVEVVIVGRGGGSMEDLWAFNEESVARAIFASELPVISAVGHETDFTIADFVSDLRAPTPSAAAELATTRLADKKEDARALAERLERNLQAVLTVSKRRLEFLKERPVLKRPLELMQKKERMLAEQERLLYKETAGQLQRLSRGLLAAEGRLAAVSPFSVMNRGYAMLMDEGGTPLTTAQAAKIGQAVRIRMKDGILQAEVTGKAVFADGEKETNL